MTGRPDRREVWLPLLVLLSLCLPVLLVWRASELELVLAMLSAFCG